MSLSEANTHAIGAVTHWIAANIPEAVSLDPRDYVSFPNTKAGWSLTLEDHDAVLLLDGVFPYSLPRVALLDSTPAIRLWPHIEADGKLCLAPAGSGVDSHNPVAVVQETLRSAAALIRENAAGLHREDYQIDFQAYWRRGVSRSIRTLLHPSPPSRVISSLLERQRHLLAENPDAGCRWLQNRLGGTVDPVITNAAFIWLDDLPDPPDYPATALQLRNLVSRRSKDGLAVIDRVITAEARAAHVVLAGQTKTRPSLGALILQSKVADIIPGRKAQTNIKGFRPGRAPAHIAALHKTAERLRVDRVDDFATRFPPEYALLREKEVAIIGCGSLGSGVARQLAMAGVSSLTLIDPETLDWANIGRHELGAPAVGVPKVKALATALRAALPQIREVRSIEADWRVAYADEPDLFDTCSLIVSAIGSWNPEVALDDLSMAGSIPCPVLYGWLENRACAAHALALGVGKGCLRCGFTEVGQPVLRATLWPDQDIDPRCGGGISLYGAVDLALLSRWSAVSR